MMVGMGKRGRGGGGMGRLGGGGGRVCGGWEGPAGKGVARQGALGGMERIGADWVVAAARCAGDRRSQREKAGLGGDSDWR